jgi:hypothetical protein
LSLADGKQLSVGRAARLTPLAIDKARELGISIIPDTT